jgi:hypothetical protein
MPRVSTPPPRPGAPPGSIEDTIPLVDGRILRREMVRDGTGAVNFDRGRVAVYATQDGGVDSQREYAVRAGEQEMLFADARGVGIAFWNGRRIVAERVGASSEEAIEASVTDLTRPCSGASGDSLRIWPLFAEALPFPRVQGMPPSVADARYTLSRDERGICVSRLEGEGPWGRVFVDAVPDAGMRGDLSLSESVNPVTCGPTMLERGPP